jgi:uncharacterized membrane protein YhfC
LQNIDPVYFLIPIIVIGFGLGLVLYWHFRRRLTGQILLYALVAYAGAIILKYAVQIPTINAFNSAVGGNPAALGIYYGIQTSVFEVGGAYVVALYLLKRNKIKAEDAGGYGISLAFWENGVLLGIISGATSLINLTTYYAILSSGTNSLSQTVYNALTNSTTGAPGLFYPPASALPDIGFAILERVSSLLAHFSWGYLVVLAVVFRRRLYLAVALPMGFLDFSVPFASYLGTAAYEFLIFGVSIVFLIIALTVTRNELGRRGSEPQKKESDPGVKPESLMYINFKRALNYGKLYVIIAIVISVLYGAVLSTVINGATTGSSAAAGVSSNELSQIPALLLPVFAIIGSFGSLMVFVSDKDKGVYEYLIAYGVEPSNIFWSIVVASFGLVSIILTISVSSSLIIQSLSGVSISPTYVELIFFYVIPISYTATAFGNMAGMIWSALTKRRTGVNSPVGLAPFLGVVPMLIVLLLTGFIGSGAFILLVSSVSGAVLLLLIFMVGVANQKMSRERFLSSEQ